MELTALLKDGSSRTLTDRPAAEPAAAAPYSPLFWAVFLLAHIPLALAMKQYSSIATLHAFISIGMGIGTAVLGRDHKKIAFWGAYIVASEVLWRMTQAEVFWESGKYAITAISAVGLLRTSGKWRSVGLPTVFLLLLLPSIFLTLRDVGDFAWVVNALSFNLSGPLSLTLCALYFPQLRLSASDLRSIIWVLVAPILAIGALAISNTYGQEFLTFTGESNFVTSGGFGPNQVSSVLGLGALLCLIAALNERQRGLRWMFMLLTIQLASQSMLTFSRGGSFNVLICVFIMAMHYLRQPRLRANFASLMLALVLLLGFYVIPRLDTFTGGKLEDRFSQVSSTNRLQIAQEDIVIWRDNPILGVGPGLGDVSRYNSLRIIASAHTEFTRMLAEHGIFGFFAILMLLLIVWRAYWSARTILDRSLVAVLAGWSLVEMTHSAMRIGMVSLIFGLALVQWKTDESELPERNV